MQKAQEPVKSVKELFPPLRVYDCLQREPFTDDGEWLLKELRWYGRFTGMAWMLSPEPAGKTQLPIPTVEDIILSPDFVLIIMSRNARDAKNGRFGERAPQLTMLAKLAILAVFWPISSN